MLSLSWTKRVRFAAIINGVFVGVGITFLLWGATDIAFPITERMSVAVFGLMRIILGIISLSVGVGVEAVQWAKIGNERSYVSSEEPTYPEGSVEKPLEKPAEMSVEKPVEKPLETTQPPTNS
jgi:hypothetical protein